MDFDLPSGDLDSFDEETHEALALREVELVECGDDAGGEALDSLA